MTCRQVELVLALLLDHTQVRPQRCLGDRLSIVVIVLLPLHEGFGVDRRDNPRLVTKRPQRPADKMRAQAGFHANDARWQPLKHLFETQPPDLPTKRDRPIGAQSNKVKYLLADVDTDYRQ
jgi:hypothetical protein